MNLFTTVGVGVENIVSKELSALGISTDRVEPGRLRFQGDFEVVAKAVVHLRCVSRVIRELAFQEIQNEQDLYDVTHDIEWEKLISPDCKFRVTLKNHSSLLKNGLFGTYRIKDAIVDRMIDNWGRRPDVELEKPEICVYAYLENRRFSVGLDASGDPLHMRGYRVSRHAGSLREHLAAAMIMHSGWTPDRPLLDPFCGSGTIPIEAAMIATNTPPSYLRKQFSCEYWKDFDKSMLRRIRDEANAAIVRPLGLRIEGSDAHPDAVEMTRANVTSAGFSGLIRVQQVDAAEREPLLSGYIVTNPPYGERLGSQEDSLDSIRALRVLALASRGSNVMALNANEEFEKAISLRPTKKNRMNNGAIKCTLYQYRIGE